MEKLTHANYYQDTERLSTSRFKLYMECEAKAVAIETGDWTPSTSSLPLVIGNYIHSYFENPVVHQQFLSEYKDTIFTKKGDLRAEFKVADKVISTLKNDNRFTEFYDGEDGDDVVKEYILDDKIFGVPFKGKLDSINFTKKYFVDLKTMRSIFDKKYIEKLGYLVPTIAYNIFEYGYHIQSYVYQTLLLKQELDFFTPYIVAVSKEVVPDKKLVLIDNAVLKFGKTDFERCLLRVAEVALGGATPKKCGHCDYCKAHQELNEQPITLHQLLYK